MNPIALIITLLVAQAVLIVGASLCYMRSKRTGRRTSYLGETLEEQFSTEDQASGFGGYMINSDPGVTLDDVFRD